MLTARMTVVALSGETRDGMHGYLSRLGAEVRSTAELERVPDLSKGADVIIFFADDYERPVAAAAVHGAIASHGSPGVVVVTGDEDRFRAALGRNARAPNLTFLCRPVWGWAMADAIRAHVAKRRPKKDA